MRVIVAGAGIGGLVAAIALHEQGIEVQVYESVREVAPLGVGINVLPHAMGVLAELGIMPALMPLGVATSELCFFNRHGQLIWREPRGLDAGYPVPQLSVHRGRLQLKLLEIARARLGADAVRTGSAVRAFTTDDGRPVSVTLEDRQNERERHDSADVLIGADGIHSTIRASFYPDQGLPHWSGNLLWRATSLAKPFLTGRSMFMAGHLPHKFVAYPISGPGPDGRCVVNWVAELDWRAHGMTERESWNRLGDVTDFLPRFLDWNFDWLDIPALIRSAEAVYEFPMVDRDPVPSWTRGRVTLLGDAAHPMYPVGSNGASQAILDARAIAGALGDARSGRMTIEDALKWYDDERRPKTAHLVAMNRQHGPEIVMDMAESRAPNGFSHAGEVFEPRELEEIAASYKRAAGLPIPGISQPAS